MELREWASLSSEVPVSPADLDVAGWLEGLEGQRRSALGPDLGRAWSDLAAEALASAVTRTTWATPATLLACAPASVPEGAFMDAARRQAEVRSAGLAAPIFPVADADRAHWSHYRRWLRPEAAEAMDGGSLRAVAFTDVSGAARAALEATSPDIRDATALSSDGGEVSLQVSSDRWSATVDGTSFAFVGLMRGFLPEQTFAAAVAGAAAAMGRAGRLLVLAGEAVGASDLRLRSDTPVHRVGATLVVDPLSERFLAGEDLPPDWEPQLRAAVAPGGLGPACTCREERSVVGSLRRAADLGPSAGAPPPLHRRAGPDHILAFLSTCPHDDRRPRADDWAGAGMDAWSAERAWTEAPAGQLLVTGVGGRASRAALVYGREIAGYAVAPPLGGPVARRVGFDPGEELTAYAPTANLLFLSDERFGEERVLRDALEAGELVEALQARGMPLGADVGFLGGLSVPDRARDDIAIRRLELVPPRAGRRS